MIGMNGLFFISNYNSNLISVLLTRNLARDLWPGSKNDFTTFNFEKYELTMISIEKIDVKLKLSN